MSRKIEHKADVQSQEDLHRARWQYEPVLGKDSFLAVLSYSWTRLWAIHFFTPSGAWAWTAYAMTLWMLHMALTSQTANDKLSSLVLWSGAHAAFAWLWLCARDQARKVIEAVAERIRGSAG